MKKVLRNAAIGSLVGISAPVFLAIANEVLWNLNNQRSVNSASVCFADRNWYLFKIEVKHAKGCKSLIADSMPLTFAIGALTGSLIGLLSNKHEKSSRIDKSVASGSLSASTAKPPSPNLLTSLKPEASQANDKKSTFSNSFLTIPQNGKVKGIASVIGIIIVTSIIGVGLTRIKSPKEVAGQVQNMNPSTPFSPPSSSREQAKPGELIAIYPNPCTDKQFGSDGATCMSRNGFITIGGWYVKMDERDSRGIAYQYAQYSSSKIRGGYADCVNQIGYNRTHAGRIGGAVPMNPNKVSYQVCKMYF